MIQMQRRLGRLRTRTADESQVSVLLKDYYDAEKMLAKIIDATKGWRDAWVSILGHQYVLINEFEGLYNPIVGASEGHDGPEYAVTPRDKLARVGQLREGYEELRTDLLDEVNMVDLRIIKPAIEAKEFIQPVKKVIKKREDKKLDYERYQNRVDSLRKKVKRTDKENAALAKADEQLRACTEEYHAADDHLRSTLPGIVTAAFTMLPPLLSAQILIQNSLLAQYYTALQGYCEEAGFPSPPAEMEEIIASWEGDFKGVQNDMETGFSCISSGKAVKRPMGVEEGSRFGMNNMLARLPSGQALRKKSPSPGPETTLQIEAEPQPPPPDASSKPRVNSEPSQPLMALMASSESSTPAPSDDYTPGTGGAFSPAAPRADYFAKDRGTPNSLAAAAKKKPPPPPPKRAASTGLWVTALYRFDGQNMGDLAFKEGDKIRVVKKTDSTDDWWEGELRGLRGAFPANYVQAS